LVTMFILAICEFRIGFIYLNPCTNLELMPVYFGNYFYFITYLCLCRYHLIFRLFYLITKLVRVFDISTKKVIIIFKIKKLPGKGSFYYYLNKIYITVKQKPFFP